MGHGSTVTVNIVRLGVVTEVRQACFLCLNRLIQTCNLSLTVVHI